MLLKNIIIQRKLFDKNCAKVLKHLAITSLKSIIIIASVAIVSEFVDTGLLLLNILVKGVIAVAISVTLLIVTSLKNKYFKSTVRLFKSIIFRKKA